MGCIMMMRMGNGQRRGCSGHKFSPHIDIVHNWPKERMLCIALQADTFICRCAVFSFAFESIGDWRDLAYKRRIIIDKKEMGIVVLLLGKHGIFSSFTRTIFCCCCRCCCCFVACDESLFRCPVFFFLARMGYKLPLSKHKMHSGGY